MRIRIREQGGRRLNLWFPTRLLTNRLSAKIVAKALSRSHGWEPDGEGDRRPAFRLDLSALNEEQIHALGLALLESRTLLRGEPLIEARSADGDEVRIDV